MKKLKHVAKKPKNRKQVLKKRAAKRNKPKDDFTFFTWEGFDEMYKECAKNVYMNGKIVENMLADEQLAEQLKKSPGADRLVDSFTKLTVDLLHKVKEIRELHIGKTGTVNYEDQAEMDLVFNIYSEYNAMMESVQSEYGKFADTLAQLTQEPAAFLTNEEVEEIAKASQANQEKEIPDAE